MTFQEDEGPYVARDLLPELLALLHKERPEFRWRVDVYYNRVIGSDVRIGEWWVSAWRWQPSGLEAYYVQRVDADPNVNLGGPDVRDVGWTKPGQPPEAIFEVSLFGRSFACLTPDPRSVSCPTKKSELLQEISLYGEAMSVQNRQLARTRYVAANRMIDDVFASLNDVTEERDALENGVLRAEISTLRKQIDEVAPVFMDAGDGAHYLNKLCPFCRTKSGRLDPKGHAVWCPWLKNHEALQRVETGPQLDVDVPVLQHKEASHD